MRIGTMLRDVLESFFKRPVTQKYPFEKLPAPGRLRGKLNWTANKCTGCGLCAKDCPSNAIEVIMIDKVKRQFIVRYHIDRCTFCAQCTQNCRFNCLSLSPEEWELAALNKEAFVVDYGTEENIKLFLEKFAPELAGEPAAAG